MFRQQTYKGIACYHRAVAITVLLLLLSFATFGQSYSTGFVEETSCVSCHAEQSAEWQTSHHAKAMDHATEATVLGNFDNISFEHFGVTSRFYRRDGRFYVNTEGPKGAMEDYEVKYVFGVEPLQQYLIEFPGGRIQALSIVWDTQKLEWYHLYQSERIKPGDPLHWTGTYQNWNMMCGECHTTNYQKNFDPVIEEYQTTFSAINVGCQACHGPAAEHLAWAQSDDRSLSPMPAFTSLMSQGQSGQIGQCAQCHSRRTPTDTSFDHGKPFLDQYAPALLRSELYHVDGQIQDEVYVYGSFLQSKMYGAGVTCTHCHNPHGLGLKFDGNAVCTQCHNPAGNADFSALTKNSYDSPEHHHHSVGSPGAQCVNCHMPATNYMVIDARRDHSFSIPRPDMTVALDTPNACTRCHEDKSAEWAVQAMASWGIAPQKPHDFAGPLFGARNGIAEIKAELVKYLRDGEKPAIRRATLVADLPVQDRVDATLVLEQSLDDDPMVRAAALDTSQNLPQSLRHQMALRMIEDSSRLVRLRAASALADMAVENQDVAVQAKLIDLFEDYEASLVAMADSPGSRFNLAVFYQRKGRLKESEAAYRKTLTLDPSFLPARFNLANYLSGQQRFDEAHMVLQDGLDWAPEDGRLHYSMGLNAAEQGRPLVAIDALQQSIQRDPDNVRAYFNQGLLLRQVGRLDDARRTLVSGYRRFPNNPDLANALVYVAMDQGDWLAARRYLRVLETTFPGDPNIAQLRSVIEARIQTN